jgi:hypothetical protein
VKDASKSVTIIKGVVIDKKLFSRAVRKIKERERR